MRYYSDTEFTNINNTKRGVVVEFKRVLKDNGLIGNRVRLTDNHKKLFQKSVAYKSNTRSTWEHSFIHMLKEEGLLHNTQTEKSCVSNDEQKLFSQQIKSILDLYDQKTLNESQIIQVIKSLV